VQHVHVHVHLHVHVHVHAYAYVHVDPHTLTSCRSAPYREGRGRRSAPWAGTTVRRANGGGGPLPGCPHTQRSLKIRGPGRLGCGPPRLLRLHIGTEGGRCEARSGVSSCAARCARPRASVIATLEDQSSARLQAAGCSPLATWTGADNAVVFPRPGQTGPLPRRKATWYTVTLKDSIGLNPHVPRKRSTTTDPVQNRQSYPLVWL
jgi:hypothetical protein